MKKNIDLALANQEKIEGLEEKSESLHESAKLFEKKSSEVKRHFWYGMHAPAVTDCAELDVDCILLPPAPLLSFFIPLLSMCPPFWFCSPFLSQHSVLEGYPAHRTRRLCHHHRRRRPRNALTLTQNECVQISSSGFLT